MPTIFPFNTIHKYPGEFRDVTVISVFLLLILAVCLCDAGNAVSAEKTIPEKNELSESIQAKDGSLNGRSNAANNPEKGLKSRDPMSIPDEIERQMGNVEPPEVRVTGIIETDKKKAAIAELNLENFKGVVMFEPGMTVSMPKPDRNESTSNRWMTLFTVEDITGHGVLIMLENGEKVWIPLMGEKK